MRWLGGLALAAVAVAVELGGPASADAPVAAVATVTAVPSPGATTIFNGNPRFVFTGEVTNSSSGTIYCALFNTATITLGTTAPVIAPIAVMTGTTQPFYIPPTAGTGAFAASGSVVAIGCTTLFNGSAAPPQNTVAVSIFYVF